MANYNFSDGDVTFAATGDTTLLLVDNGSGVFDNKTFSFLRSGNDLIIYANNGHTITLQDHYSSSLSFTFINHGTAAQPKLQLIADSPNVLVGTTSNATLTTTEHILGGTGDNTINANASRIYAGDGDDVITNNSNGSSNTGNIIYAGTGNDTIYEGIGTGDDAYGGDGDDTFYANASVVNGSEWRGDGGNDSYHVNIKSSGTLIWDDSGTNDTLYFGVGLNFENFLMYHFSDDMTIVSKDTSALNVFEVTLKDQYSTDTIDKVVFADGTTYTIENNRDWYADDTDNTIYAAAGLYNLHGGLGNDVIYGVEYVDTPIYGVHVTNWIPTLYGDEGDDIIHHGWTGIGGPRSGGESFGGTGNDVIHGTDYDDTMHGGDGDDIMFAYGHDNATRDIMDGGNGDDTFYIGTGTQKDVEGGAGWDVIYSELNSGPIHFSGSAKTHLQGGADNDVYVFLRDDTAGSVSAKAWINDTGGDYDTVALSSEYSLSNVTIQGVAFLTVNDLHSVLGYHMIEVNANFPNNVIERVVFADGTIYDTTTSSVITATMGDDNPIYLTAWHDTFDSLAGNDVVFALEGDDHLYGNAGNDVFDGGSGTDTIDYSNAAAGVNVHLNIGTAYDDGDGGVDTLTSIENVIGSAHNDTLHGDNSDNEISGGTGNDILFGEDGNDTMYGGGGDDSNLNGGAGDDIIFGGNGADTLVGWTGANQLYGGDGDDIIHSHSFTDTIDGGTGTDRYYSHLATEGVVINTTLGTLAATSAPTVPTGSVTNIEMFYLSNFADSFTGNNANEIAQGYDGDDIMHGEGGNDALYGGAGSNTLHGGDGDDQLISSSFTDTIDGGAGHDRYYSAHTAEGVIINTTLSSIAATSAPTAPTGSIGNVEAYYLGDFVDTFTGNSTAEIIASYGGNDILRGEGGDDLLYGGDGADELHGGDGDDEMYGQNGNDTMYGGAGEDLLKGNEGNDEIYGGTEHDVLYGGNGADMLYGDEGDDSLSGESDNDILHGGDGDDWVLGGDGNDTLYGGDGLDNLFGEAGDDVLHGGIGNDRMTGGTGADTFVFADSPGNNTIYDFSTAEGDVLDISDLLTAYDPLTDVLTDFVEITDNGQHSYLKIDADGGADSFVQISMLANVTGLTDEQALANDGNLFV
ncbi:MAG: type I secretion C-terminal target domain-containing protein [Roseibium sp.]